MNEHSELEIRPCNWLPVPCDDPSRIPQPQVDENDFFSKGVIESLFVKQKTGSLKSDRGLVIPFDLTQVTLIGQKNNPKFLAEGLRVGYDVVG